MTGKQFRRIRKRLELTQRQFAKEMGWHPNSVARAEQGKMTISPTAEKLARLLLAVHTGTVSKSRKGKRS
jgi:transcriptional regulator with XRE-family HTH domain